MRLAFYLCAIGGFAALALYDLTHGRYQVGVAGIMLAIANGLLLR